MIKPLLKEHSSQVALLHIQGISTGFISSLGHKFVTALYESIAESPYGFGFVEEDEGKVLAFVAFTTNLGGLYKSILKKNVIRFSWLLFYRLFSWKKIKRIFETLFYPARVEKRELPKSELLSIAVSHDQRGKGLAATLIMRGLRECSLKEIPQVKVLVADFNEPANRLYQKTGFVLVSQVESHGIVSNLYVVSTADIS